MLVGEKKNQWQRKYFKTYYPENIEKFRGYMKKYRSENKEKIRLANKKYRDRIKLQGKSLDRKEKIVENFKNRVDRLSDGYVRNILTKHSAILTSADIPKEVVDVYRFYILIKRKLKEKM